MFSYKAVAKQQKVPSNQIPLLRDAKDKFAPLERMFGTL